MRLHGYLQSSATWQVRAALALKGLTVPEVLHRLPDGSPCPPGEASLGVPGGLPALELPDGTILTQSLAILEWLEEIWPSPPLLPPDPLTRARVRAFAMTIACEVQPLHAPRMQARLTAAGLSEGQVQGWMRQMSAERLDVCETMLCGMAGPFCFGDVPGLADACLVPQLHAARQLSVHLAFPRLLAAEAACMTLPAFRQVHPEMLHVG
ncbi:glutathione S-transferase N-terminal domain-containing protein [Roseomonas sp. E05]|uniref:glutathione S-transferase N-terminal domain-containing protein n=1 Tax=Roseomonas sp. E05 TaxID=3046310 RepID=UPI0024BACCBB|nr:glutathione S-transferase N-terminal domain-containing protein [Roseomonas sp. E05]MDJ0390843.1 glutathione S-transferase N-terminal domain-containing protein [Roseomonas sp. E05]